MQYAVSRLREFSINNFSLAIREEENNLGACQAKLHRQCSCALSMNIIFPIRLSPSPLVALIEINQKRDLDEYYSPSPSNRSFHFHQMEIHVYIYINFLNKLSVHDTRGVQSKFMQSGIAKNGASRDESQRKGSKTCRFWNLRHSMRMTFFSSVQRISEFFRIKKQIQGG